MKTILMTVMLAGALVARAGDEAVRSPDGRIVCTVGLAGGLHYSVTVDGQPVLVESVLGLEFKDGLVLGPQAHIEKIARVAGDTAWENPFGQRRNVQNHFHELHLELSEAGHRFGLIVRAYNNGVAFRYDLPNASGLGEFVLTHERTEFAFVGDFPCWYGEESNCAENQYPGAKLSLVPKVEKLKGGGERAFRSVLPLLVAAPNCHVAIAESDLLDWAGMFLAGTGGSAVQVSFEPRKDQRGAVVGRTPCVSPWRVLMIGRQPADLIGSDLILNLATPSKLADTSWIKPGITAWDAWWTGENPSQPAFTNLNSRGDTRSHKEYIDFAAEMGFPYQLIDWYWYEPMNNPKADLTKPAAHVDIPGLIEYARAHNVRLLLWIDSRDIHRQGVELVLDQVAKWGFAGVKIDFMNSDDQETVRWYVATLAAAAQRKLLVDFHGAYKPTGLARTWPNFITQEGVLGNEYNKIPGNKCTPLHTTTLPFTRGLLGPMDFTPGGFLNVRPADFKISVPAVVQGTRARQLAMTVVYFSPLLVLCDSPAHYRGQPGVEFFRGLPTVWDETRALSAEVAKHVVIARRSGDRWWLAALNSEEPVILKIPLKFLGGGEWILRQFADTLESVAQPTKLSESSRVVKAGDTLDITLAPAGGYAATLTPKK